MTGTTNSLACSRITRRLGGWSSEQGKAWQAAKSMRSSEKDHEGGATVDPLWFAGPDRSREVLQNSFEAVQVAVAQKIML